MKRMNNLVSVFLLSLVLMHSAQGSSIGMQIVTKGLNDGFSKIIGEPSMERLETKETFKAGDLVKVVHGGNYSRKGKVVGSFAQLTGKNTSQDVLAALKQKPEDVGVFFLAFMSEKDMDFLEQKKQEGNGRKLEEAEEVAHISQMLLQKPLVLDAQRLYKIDFVKDESEEEARVGFDYEHVASLKRIDQKKYDEGYKSDYSDSSDEEQA